MKLFLALAGLFLASQMILSVNCEEHFSELDKLEKHEIEELKEMVKNYLIAKELAGDESSEEDNDANIVDSGENEDEDDEEKRGAYLRFGKRMASYIRFGKRYDASDKRGAYLRFGKRAGPAYLRFGKRAAPAYLRFGKRSNLRYE